MKKLLCFLLILVIAIPFTACRAARGMSFDESDTFDVSTAEESLEVITQSNVSPLLWKVTAKDGKNILWLFGSIHAADSSTYPLPAEVMSAYKSSGSLAVECDVTDLGNNIAEIQKSAVYSDGSTIKTHIPEDLYNKSKKILEAYYGSALSTQLDKFKPIMWYTLIEGIYTSKSKLSSDNGIDTYFINEAKSGKKELLQVESVEFQYKLLFGFSEKIQVMMLSEIVKAGQEGFDKDLDETYEAWAKGDAKAIEAMLNEDTSGYTKDEIKTIDEYNKAMITDRNINMAEKVKEYLSEGKNVFFVVGEAHMVGDGGIVKLLTDAGYKVEQVQTNAKSGL